MTKLKRKTIIMILLLMIAVSGMAAIDYYRVTNFEMPFFCYSTEESKSNRIKCYGIGYSFVVRGHFKADDELNGITEYTYYLLGKEIIHEFRD